jgi:hypothetical protein
MLAGNFLDWFLNDSSDLRLAALPEMLTNVSELVGDVF